MTQEERYGERDRSYSVWHRRQSTRRFVGIEAAQNLAMIDLDAALWIEYDNGSKEPLVLIETALDVGQPYKTATVTTNLARMCSENRPLPAFVVLYKLSESPNPADYTVNDIESFRVKRLWPNPEYSWRVLTPQDWASYLVAIRKKSASCVDLLACSSEGANANCGA